MLRSYVPHQIGADQPEGKAAQLDLPRKKGSNAVSVHHRSVAPSSTLVMMVIMLLELVYNGNEKGGANKKVSYKSRPLLECCFILVLLLYLFSLFDFVCRAGALC